MPEISSSGVSASSRAFSALLVFLVVSATYLYTFPQPNIFYAVIVLLHATTGVVAAVMLAIFFFRLLRNGSFAARAGWVLLAAGAVIGIVLIKTDTRSEEHTSELQSPCNLVCRLLLEKKKKNMINLKT